MLSTAKCVFIHGVLACEAVNNSSQWRCTGVQSEDMPYSPVLECGMTEAEHLCLFHCLGGILPFNEIGRVMDL